MSFPRKRESRLSRRACCRVWIPAFAGMTSQTIPPERSMLYISLRFAANPGISEHRKIASDSSVSISRQTPFAEFL